MKRRKARRKEQDRLLTRQNRVHYGDREFIEGTPVARIKSRGKIDYVTVEEFAEDLFGRKVEAIVFCD